MRELTNKELLTPFFFYVGRIKRLDSDGGGSKQSSAAFLRAETSLSLLLHGTLPAVHRMHTGSVDTTYGFVYTTQA